MVARTFRDAAALRDEVKAFYLKDYLKVPPGTNFMAYGLADSEYLPPDRRLGIGIAFGEKKLGVALRVPKREGLAHKAAMEIKARLEGQGEWSDLRIVERITVPSRSDVRSKNQDPSTVVDEGAPLTLGASIAHPKSSAGSIGGFVNIRGTGEGIISACHVIANAGRDADLPKPNGVGSPTFHPAHQDVDGPLSVSKHQIGNLVDYVGLNTPRVEVDAAVSKLMKGTSHSGNVVPKVLGAAKIGQRILLPTSPDDVVSARKVAKVGRTTGYTEGYLSAGFFDDVALEVPGQGLVYYTRLFEIEGAWPRAPFAEPGDSGALVYDTDAMTAIGLVVGGGEWDDKGVKRVLVYACSLHKALRALDAEWL